MFRISNDTQRAKNIATIEGFKRQRENIEKKEGKKVGDAFWKGVQSLIRDFEEQVKKYDELTKGLPPFQGKDLRDLGSYLVDARIAAGITQDELAKKLGVSQPMVFKYEINEYQGYSLEIIEKAAKALNVKVDLSAWRDAEKPVYNANKQEQAMLHFLHRINNVFLGKTKLMKLLYYADFEFYAKEKKTLTGDQYVAQTYGPLPQHAEALLKKMESEGKIHVEQDFLGRYPHIRYYPKVRPDMGIFSAAEAGHLEDVSRRFEHWSASQMTNQTHEEYPWKITPFGKVIDYHLAFRLEDKDEQA